MSSTQQAAIDEAIRITQFLRNTCLRVWMDGRRVSENDLQLACSRLAHAVAFVAPLNSQARQAAAARAWAAISRFYAHCPEKRPGKKGYPRFQQDCRSVEYKVTGWRLDADGRHLTLTDGCGIGRGNLIGSREVHTFPLEQIKRVRLLRRADGYYAQFVLEAERRVAHVPTGRVVGIAVGLHVSCRDSEGQAVATPRFIHQVAQRVRRRSRWLSSKSLHHQQGKHPKHPTQQHAARQRAKHNRYPPVPPPLPLPAPVPRATALGCQPAAAPAAPAGTAAPTPSALGADASPVPLPLPLPARPRPGPVRQSANWHRARQTLARTSLHLQRQREDFARKQANALVSSSDLMALEDLQIRNLVKNRRRAKASSDASWGRFRHGVEYYGRVQQVPVLAVPPPYTSQACSGCGKLVRKSLSVRTHVCPHCGLIRDRDQNAAMVSREAGLAQAIQLGIWDAVRQARLVSGTVGHTET